jgi:N-acetyl-gamma-glutamyl-phosphate reductase
MARKRIGLFGASGYAGCELIKILARHDGVDLVAPNTPDFEGLKGRNVRELDPDCPDGLAFTAYSIDEINALGLDLVLLATPDPVSEKIVPRLNVPRIVDLSRAYRAKPEEAVYCLPEHHRERARGARLIANPGCYPTACQLAALPLVQTGRVERIVFNCLSGFSGAGRAPLYVNDPKNYRDNVIPYKITRHAHEGEIRRQLGMPASFTPHVVPFFRGILATAHLFMKEAPAPEAVRAMYVERYRSEPFVKVLDRLPEIRDARGTNLCCLGGFEVDDVNRVVIVSTIDNLVKGAAGQAVQNMNLMLGFPETQGLL